MLEPTWPAVVCTLAQGCQSYIATAPVLDMRIEELTIMETKAISWTVGGSCYIKGLYRAYFRQVNAIIWVQDACVDGWRLSECRIELELRLSAEELEGYPLLVFANKQDLPNAMDKEELIRYFNLHSLDGKRPWRVFNSVATEKEVLEEGFAWLQQVVADPSSSYVAESYVPTKSANKI